MDSSPFIAERLGKVIYFPKYFDVVFAVYQLIPDQSEYCLSDGVGNSLVNSLFCSGEMTNEDAKAFSTHTRKTVGFGAGYIE